MAKEDATGQAVESSMEQLLDINRKQSEIISAQARTIWKSHATLTLLATQDCPLWLQYD